MRFTKQHRKMFLLHILFWVVYLGSNSYLWKTFDKTYNETTIYGLTRLPVKVIAVYINLYLLNQLFFRRRYLLFSCFFLLNLVAAGLVQTYLSAPRIFNYESF